MHRLFLREGQKSEQVLSDLDLAVLLPHVRNIFVAGSICQVFYSILLLPVAGLAHRSRWTRLLDC